MMGRSRAPAFAAAVIMTATLVVLVAALSLFTVDERERALLLQFGQPVGAVRGPGLHVRIPMIQTVVRFDARTLSVDPPPAQMVISSRDNPVRAASTPMDNPDGPEADNSDLISGEPIIVETYARYRISDPLQFLKTLGSVKAANQRIESIMNDATRSVLGSSTLRQLLSPARARVMENIAKLVNGKIAADRLGITLVDIRIVRADLTPELRQSTVTRMISELRERATETRSKGEQNALEIRSGAEKERTVLLANADRDAQTLEGEGDKKAIAIYAESYNRDREFYDFTRSLETYRRAMTTPGTQLILSPDNDLLKYFRQGPGDKP